MKSIVTIEHENKTVTDIVKVQETGKASLVKVLHALGIQKSMWNTTLLQITAFAIPPEEPCVEHNT